MHVRTHDSWRKPCAYILGENLHHSIYMLFHLCVFFNIPHADLRSRVPLYWLHLSVGSLRPSAHHGTDIAPSAKAWALTRRVGALLADPDGPANGQRTR